MMKLVILIEPPQDLEAFETLWPEYLHRVEAMPGLRRETISRVDHHIFGAKQYFQMQELFFDGILAAEQALASPVGQLAGGLLQQISGGRMTLFFADHREDDAANLQRFRQDAPTDE